MRVLFDAGSQKSYISKRIRDVLNLPTKNVENLTVATFENNESVASKVESVEFFMKGLHSDGKILVHAHCVPTICLPLSDQPIKVAKQNYDHIKNLRLADTGEGDLAVDLLVGSDFYWSTLTGRVLRGDGSGPVALESKVGWILSGSVGAAKSSNNQNVNLVNSSSTHVLFVETRDRDSI